MKLKNLLFLTILFLFSTGIFSQPTEIVYLSGSDAANTVEWDFFCTDGKNSGEWTKIPVPSNWELQGFGTYNYGHDWRNEEIKLGKEHGLYKHEFETPASWKGKTINIVFDGSMTDTEVKINGKLAGEIHQGAFYRFKYDISKLLNYGKTNLLEVDVAKHSSNESVNRAERQADFWIFGGIFRPVFLEVLPETHMTRTAIDPKADGSFKAFVTLNESKADYTFDVELFDLGGNKVSGNVQAEISKGETENWISGKFENVKEWNVEWPQLYDMKISLKKGNDVLHQVTERIGFRTVELREHDGIYVNGEKVIFKGVCRHSFRPETGRALSDSDHFEDITLMKEMNMNAVRCSHYDPDKRFLDLCDSLGMLVLDEVTGWQDSYDTIIGPKLIKEEILKDENHASVVLWDHGNEGGWDFANEKTYQELDIQKRPVIYPWLLRNGVDTHHYPEFLYAVNRFTHGNAPFMPTEFMHGLYDGGHGAGLNDFWNEYETSPLLAGAFLWVFADEAVLRTDKEGTVYDSDGNHAPDGILGPHQEKEGSFYTIKDIWSPVQISPVTINKQWNGKLFLSNKYIYTNLNKCTYSWKAIKTGFGDTANKVLGQGQAKSPNAEPGETAAVQIDCSNALQNADLFEFTATDYNGNELYTWSWPVVQPEEKAAEILQELEFGNSEISVNESSDAVTVSVSGLEISLSKNDGTLLSVENSNGDVSFTGGPIPVGADSEITGTKWEKDGSGNFIFTVSRKDYPRKITWTLEKSGLLKLEASHLIGWMKDIDYIGISFNYPEEKCTGIKWMGGGPYRVWKNRLKGATLGVWEKEYNNTITGESFNNLVYPEFKGYHGNLYWATLETTESPITIISETPKLYMQLFTPDKPQHVAGGTYPAFPDADISFLYEIPGIGTKFQRAEIMGPNGQKGVYGERRGDENDAIKLWFDFRSN
ncbi:beta-galactosidase [Maribellus comscasis]|uniref:beta-galactosidase n=1 Tax=Maribellus comscasis TaxID=2681766 RepID=A0A6I6JPB6_9BACT|nr:glycoside hydrolase family 2 TIM barrel-domain containing protein [Maribellus comscasis]QGY44311.1 beta-galactosidase [Maribellus comscasis]